MLDGKIALITGSTRGIGWATARIFAQYGATVILNGHSDSSKLNDRVSELKKEFGHECTGMHFDVSDAGAVRNCYQSIFKQFKRLDVLVNNAGIVQDSFLGMISQESMQATFAVNTLSAMTNLQEASRLMSRSSSGSIINMTSIIGLRGDPGLALYSASKSALVGLTLSAAKELAPKNIRVNAIAPGFIDTDMARAMPADKFEKRIQSIAMGRIGSPEEVAKVALFLASDLSSYITGQIIGVDGGMLI